MLQMPSSTFALAEVSMPTLVFATADNDNRLHHRKINSSVLRIPTPKRGRPSQRHTPPPHPQKHSRQHHLDSCKKINQPLTHQTIAFHL